MTFTKIPFIWGVSEENTFLEIKKIMVALPVLALPNSDKPFIVETNASDFAVGAVLLQVGDDNLEHPVAFFSRKMLPAETNYPVHNKEMLAIISTLKEWPHYLMNACYPVVIRSDHKSLEYFKLPQRLSQRQARWHHTLAHYQFKIEYKKGDLNHIADMLSRDPGHKFNEQELNDFNNITLLPNFCFHVDKSPATLRDRILDAQTYDLFSQRKLLEIEQATSSSKAGCFTANANSL